MIEKIIDENGAPIIDRFGKETYHAVDVITDEQVFEEVCVGRKLIKPAGERFGIRYNQALALESALMRRELKKINSSSR